MTIKVFVTGGTFDKEYNEINGELFFQDTHLKEMFRLGRSQTKVEVRTIMMVDSFSITDHDRQIILQNCLKTKEDKILITHGTDTMVETASLLAEQITNKTIVLTGAMIPYTFDSSDGLFNLGSALAYVQILPNGIYIAMNDRYFNWNNVKKNKKTGYFEEINLNYDRSDKK
jgi:L-asparaginase